jgi:hypothetical protein
VTRDRQPTARRATRLGARSLLVVLLVSMACSAHRAITSSSVDVEAPDSSASAAAELAAPTPGVAPEPAPIVAMPIAEPTQRLAPATPQQLAEALAHAQQQIDALGIRAKLRHTPSGPMPELAFLETAYDDRRAFAIAGNLEQVREWVALAKFGVDAPTEPREGPLARYDLIVTRDDDRAWLHVVVPAHGLPADHLGRHEAFIEGERWVNLADRMLPGRHYLPYKSNGNESLRQQWGRVDVIESLATIAEEYQQRTGLLLGIGDISHVTGGKILDHWTHRDGVDADVYLLDHQRPDKAGRPSVWWHHFRKGRSIWSSEPQGKGEHEARLDPEDELSDTPSSHRLRLLAQIVFPIDPIAYFVHDDPRVLTTFDREVAERRPGRRYLHAKNRGMWPSHCDHVHLRWVDGNLPLKGTPRP